MHSYFDVNSQKVDGSTTIPQSERGPLVSFLTITDFVNLLYADNTDLATGITAEFMRDVMRVDFNKAINCLRIYKGSNRKGIKEARSSMDEALQSLYAAINADKKRNADKKVKSLRSCRGKLEDAFHHLEHLK
jgi:hypothetical protein